MAPDEGVEEISREIVELRLRLEEIQDQIEESGQTPALAKERSRLEERRRSLMLALSDGGPAKATDEDTVDEEIRYIPPA